MSQNLPASAGECQLPYFSDQFSAATPMLRELAVGDAYGAGFEYASEITPYNDLSDYMRHPRHRIIPGAYSDDTHMSVALVEVIVLGADWTPLNLANAFVAAFRRDPREGYPSGFYDILRQARDGEQFLAEIHGEGDEVGPRCARACRPRSRTTHRTGSTPPSPPS